MAVPVVIKLQVEGGKVVVSELSGLGEVGDRAFHQLQDGAKRASTELSRVGVSAGGLRNAMAGLGTIAASVFTVDMARRIIEVGDAYQMMQSRLKLAAGGADAAAVAQAKLFQIAQDTRAPIADVVQTYTRLAPSLDAVGVSAADQFDVVRALGQALVISGASGSEAAAGMQQFAQAMSSGVLQGDELKSLRENFPALARAIADGLGVSVGALLDMGAAGKLTTERVIAAFLSMREKIDASFSSIGSTVSSVMTQIQNVIFDTTGSLMQTTGATNDLVTAMQSLLEAVSDPRFREGVQGILSAFIDMFANVSDGVAGGVDLLHTWQGAFHDVGVAFKTGTADDINKALDGLDAAVGETFRDMGNAALERSPVLRSIFDGLRETAPGAADALDSVINKILGVSREAKAAAAEMSAFYQTAINGPKNFAGGQNFRAAQDAGTENAMSKMAFTAPQAPKAIEPSFVPKARPQDAADKAAGAAADKAAAAAERALSEAQRIWARDEAAINEMLRQTYAAVDERGKFISSAMGKLSEVANDNQIAAMEKAADAAYKKAEMDRYAADQVARKQQIEQAGAATTREFATATEIFAAEMLELRAQLDAGAISQETYNRAAQAASDTAQQATRDANEATKKSYEETYAQVGRIVDQAYQGISAGLAAMIVQGEADFETFVDGMAQSMLQSGLQALMTGLIGGGTGGGGLIGMMMGGGATTTTASAHGNVFAGGNVIPFSRGGIVDRPVVFPMAKGAGLMGEAGPEAVMPLRRLPSGDLGVMSGGSGAPPQITITLVNETRTQMRAEQQTGPDGGLKVMLREIIGAEIGTPGTPGHMATRGVVQRYGNGR